MDERGKRGPEGPTGAALEIIPVTFTRVYSIQQ
jgi:hypothetical protein